MENTFEIAGSSIAPNNFREFAHHVQTTGDTHIYGEAPRPAWQNIQRGHVVKLHVPKVGYVGYGIVDEPPVANVGGYAPYTDPKYNAFRCRPRDFRLVQPVRPADAGDYTRFSLRMHGVVFNFFRQDPIDEGNRRAWNYTLWALLLAASTASFAEIQALCDQVDYTPAHLL